jgi:hypothetical protein
MSAFSTSWFKNLQNTVGKFLLRKPSVVLIVHRAPGAHTSTDESLQIEIERIHAIALMETLVDLPVAPSVYEIETQRLAPMPKALMALQPALDGIEVDGIKVPVTGNVSRETLTILPTVVSFRDRENFMELDELCQRAVQKFQKKHGVLPTHIIVNSMRLVSERRPDQWETFDFPFVFGGFPIKLRGMKNCIYNTARCIIEEGVKVA